MILFAWKTGAVDVGFMSVWVYRLRSDSCSVSRARFSASHSSGFKPWKTQHTSRMMWTSLDIWACMSFARYLQMLLKKKKRVTLYFKVSLLQILHVLTIIMTINMYNYMQITLRQTLILIRTI